MNLKENKEQIINMLTSEDKEIRNLAVNSIRSQYVTDFNYTFFRSVNGDVLLKISENKNEFCFNMDFFLECVICSRTKRSTIREMLDLIIEYNELKKRQR